jgi:hypothetical protein
MVWGGGDWRATLTMSPAATSSTDRSFGRKLQALGLLKVQVVGPVRSGHDANFSSVARPDW